MINVKCQKPITTSPPLSSRNEKRSPVVSAVFRLMSIKQFNGIHKVEYKDEDAILRRSVPSNRLAEASFRSITIQVLRDA